MIVVVAGDNPNHIGGHSDHNPFRLYVKERFRALLQQHPDAEYSIPLQLGPGTWCAEVAVEVGKPFAPGVVPDRASKWTERLVAHHDALLAATVDAGYAWDSNESPVMPTVLAAECDDLIHLFACWDGQRLASPAQKAVRLLEGKAHLAVEEVRFDWMPVQYQFLGVMEELRDAFPSNFEPRIAAAISKAQGLLAAANWTDASRDRALHRVNEMEMLRRIVARLEERR